MINRFLEIIKNYRLLTRFIVVIFIPAITICCFAYFKMKQGLPEQRLVLTNQAMSAPAIITRDVHGVPEIQANSDNDAYFAVGYVHAQDRLWQLELQRHMVQGRLSELFGKESISQDIWFRTIGLYQAAKTAWPALSREAQESLTAYTAGINAGMAAQKTLPAEFQILNIKPEPWTEIDSLAWIKMFAFDLGGNFRAEISRYLAGQALPLDRQNIFFPTYADDVPTTIRSEKISSLSISGMAKMAGFQENLQRQFGLTGHAVGSNAWVVSGKHTATGSVLLANDPHLGLQIPSLWYAINVKGKALNVSGMSLIGLPLVIFGHNENIAWGGTSMMADTQDLYLERPIGSGNASYEVNGLKEPFIIRTEEIAIRADFPEQLHKKYLPIKVNIRSTRHGPIISDQFHVFDRPVSLRWTALDPGDTSYEAFFRLGYAHDWASFNNALHPLVAPALNMMYADRTGNIGYLGVGRIPIRKSGDGSSPSIGWTDNYEWMGFVAPEKWPQTYNPESGYIVNANNRIADSTYPYFISRDWASPARARRITQLLTEKIDGKSLLTVSDMEKIQSDTTDLDAQAVMAALSGFTPQSDEQKTAWSYLKSWRGDMASESQAAALFHVWMRHFRTELILPYLTGIFNTRDQADFAESLSSGVGLHALADILRQPHSVWCEQDKSTAQQSCQELLAHSLQMAIDEIYKLKGDRSMSSWDWGALKTTVYPHTPFSNLRPFGFVFEKRIANGGSENTVNVSDIEYNEKDGYIQKFGPGFRQIMSLDRGYFEDQYMNSTGQSGNVLSPHYSDMVEPFRDMHYFSMQPKVAEEAGAGELR